MIWHKSLLQADVCTCARRMVKAMNGSGGYNYVHSKPIFASSPIPQYPSRS